MFSSIRKRFTFANVAMTLALVFAMTGGAYAAKKYLITSTKQISPKVLKALEGKAGPAGVEGKQGVQGPAGASGKDGVNGKDGPQGPKGDTGLQGAEGKEGPAGKEGKTGPAGPEGKEGKTGPAGPEGKEGSPWTAGGTLPTGKTETGVWIVGPSAAAGTYPQALSFPIPLAAAPAQANVHYLEPGEETTECPGSATNPTAAAGQVCIYAANAVHVSGEYVNFGANGVLSSGVVVVLVATANGAEGDGAWAVTAP